MTTHINKNAKEGSSFTVTTSVKNNAGTKIVPISARWSLGHMDRTIINNRRHVALTPALNMDIVLDGADLAITETLGDKVLAKRRLLLETTYNQGGTTRNAVEEFRFDIEPATMYPITTTTTTTTTTTV